MRARFAGVALFLAASLTIPAAAAAQTFTRWSPLCEGSDHTAGAALGDIDRDGDLDLIFSNGRHLAETDWIYSNDGRGGFYGRRALGSNPDPSYWLALGDLDGDGALDAVVANDVGARSQVYRNDGKGQFTAVAALGAAGAARRAVAIGDVDGDGDADVVLVGIGQDHIYLNNGGGRAWTERALGARAGTVGRATGVAVADVDADKDLDIVVPGRYEAESYVYVNDGTGVFAEARAFGAQADDFTAAAVGDVDGDGDPDIVTSAWAQPHAVYANDGRGRFSPAAPFGAGQDRAWSVVLADMDLDGDLDAVVGNSNVDFWNEDLTGDKQPDRFGQAARSAPSRIYVNDGRGRFSPGPAISTGGNDTRPIAVGDVDGDGDSDVVMGNDCQPNYVFFNPVRPGVAQTR